MKSLFIIFQHLVPQQLLSRLAGSFANARTNWLKNILVNRFIKKYGVNMAEALHSNAEDYASFNDFFTRALKPGERIIAQDENAIVSPADGVISASGGIQADRLIQAKDKSFSLTALLGGDQGLAELFKDGDFLTVYLSPKDYHRVHMPLAGSLQSMRYIPGKLFSVNQTTSENIEDLFARNERAVCLFETVAGPMAVILVGAMIVAAIETVWAGQVAPAKHGLLETDYRNEHPSIQLGKGEEMGRFKLGSTVIVLFGPGAMQWQEALQEHQSVQMGEAIGEINATV